MFNNSFATATVCGFVGRDARVGETNGTGTSMTSLSVAVTSRVRQADGTYADATQWIGASFFGKDGERAADVKKGDLVVITGEPKVRIYTSKGRTNAMLELRNANLTRILRAATVTARKAAVTTPEAAPAAPAGSEQSAPSSDYAAEQAAFETDNDLP